MKSRCRRCHLLAITNWVIAHPPNSLVLHLFPKVILAQRERPFSFRQAQDTGRACLLGTALKIKIFYLLVFLKLSCCDRSCCSALDFILTSKENSCNTSPPQELVSRSWHENKLNFLLCRPLLISSNFQEQPWCVFSCKFAQGILDRKKRDTP